MDFRPTDDQALLASGVADFLAGQCTPDHVRTAWDTGRHDDRRWKALAGLGVTGLTVPTDHGGMGLDERDLVGILVEAGRAALPEPVLEATAVAAPLLAELAGTDPIGAELAETWLPAIASGDAVVVPAVACDPYPAHIRAADLVLVGTGDRLWALPPGQLDIIDQPNLDGARPTAAINVPDGLAPTLTGSGVEAALARASARGALAAATMLIGAGHAMIDLAVAHAQQREQFGRPIGTFQAVKHHLADALVDITFARPLVERAACSITLGDPDAATHAAMAKAFAGDAAHAAAAHALQVHGAIGYTWECDLHLWMKRTWSLAAAWGDTETQWQELESSLI
jgi:alkylation response protein AidB-like acyl-CoA dehydrogenase